MCGGGDLSVRCSSVIKRRSAQSAVVYSLSSAGAQLNYSSILVPRLYLILHTKWLIHLRGNLINWRIYLSSANIQLKWELMIFETLYLKWSINRFIYSFFQTFSSAVKNPPEKNHQWPKEPVIIQFRPTQIVQFGPDRQWSTWFTETSTQNTFECLFWESSSIVSLTQRGGSNCAFCEWKNVRNSLEFSEEDSELLTRWQTASAIVFEEF